jgi:hypothetical protein
MTAISGSRAAQASIILRHPYERTFGEDSARIRRGFIESSPANQLRLYKGLNLILQRVAVVRYAESLLELASESSPKFLLALCCTPSRTGTRARHANEAHIIADKKAREDAQEHSSSPAWRSGQMSGTRLRQSNE